MEFIGSDDGVAAPRLAQVRATPPEATELYRQLIDRLRRDCDNTCTWFESRGAVVADAHDLFDDLARQVAAR